MDEHNISPEHAHTLFQIKQIRAQAIEHTRIARQLGAERRILMESLLQQGVSQAEIARELGVSRQAIQKMLAC